MSEFLTKLSGVKHGHYSIAQVRILPRHPIVFGATTNPLALGGAGKWKVPTCKTCSKNIGYLFAGEKHKSSSS